MSYVPQIVVSDSDDNNSETSDIDVIEVSDGEVDAVAEETSDDPPEVIQISDVSDDEVGAAAEETSDNLIGNSVDRQVLIASQNKDYEESLQTDACLDRLLEASSRAPAGLTFVTDAPDVADVLTPRRITAFKQQGVVSFVAGQPVPEEAEQCLVAVRGQYYLVGIVTAVGDSSTEEKGKPAETAEEPPSRKRLQGLREEFLQSLAKRRRF